jgi:hypothetical protein
VKFNEYVKDEGYGIYEYDYLLEFDYLVADAAFTIEIPVEEEAEEEEEVTEEVVDAVVAQATNSTEEETTEDAVVEETEFVEEVIESFLEWSPPVKARKNR